MDREQSVAFELVVLKKDLPEADMVRSQGKE
jgi:hypothetical protein